MADSVNVKMDKSKFLPHSAGPKVAQCVDVLNFGECVSEFPGKPKSLAPKIGLVFRTGEINPKTGDLIDVVAEFGAFMSPKANLRRFLEGWRGQPYTNEQAEDGIPVEKLVGKWGFLNIGHRTSASGRTYAVILSAMPVPLDMGKPSFASYTRPDYLNERKAEYERAADAFRMEIGIGEDGTPLERVHFEESGGIGLPPEEDDSEDSLPF